VTIKIEGFFKVYTRGRPQYHGSTLLSISLFATEKQNCRNWRGSFLSSFPTYNSSSVYNILHLDSFLLHDVVYSPREWRHRLVLVSHANGDCFGSFSSSIGAANPWLDVALDLCTPIELSKIIVRHMNISLALASVFL
jgi:hypothetical protein